MVRVIAAVAMTSLMAAGFLASQALDKAASAAPVPVQSVSGTAYGEYVNVTSLLNLHLTSGPIPTQVVLSPDGKTSTPASPESALAATVPNLLSVGILNASTQGVFKTGSLVGSQSSASVADVKIGTATMPILHVDVLASSCGATSDGPTGSASIVNLDIAGMSVINGAVPANTSIPLPLIGTLILNEQKKSSSFAGSSITVNSLHLVFNGILGKGDIILSQSHCDATTIAPAVSVAYADNFHEPTPCSYFPLTYPKPFNNPVPPGVIFDGKESTSGPNFCGFDAGAIKVDNSTGQTLTVHITVDIGTNHYDLWGGNQSLPNGESLIDTQIGDNFDTSDTNTQPTCVNNGRIPVVHVTINGVTTSFQDKSQILNTGGVDKQFCQGVDRNESHDWARL